MCDRRRDCRSIASEVGRSFGAVQTILTDSLGMSKLSARWVPRMLTDDQKRSRLDISRYLLSRYEDDLGDFIDRVVSQDETWFHHFDEKRSRLDISRYLLSRYEDDPGDFIDRVVSQDETWVHHFDPESKMQSMQ